MIDGNTNINRSIESAKAAQLKNYTGSAVMVTVNFA